MNIFRSAAFKLAVSYLALIMLVSIGFSIFVYQISVGELTSTLRRPLPMYYYQSNIEELRQQQARHGQINIQNNLILINIITFVIGGAASYWLARRTLQPIEEAMEAQSRFTADASHELRTPLTAMQTEIEVALRDKTLNAKQARLLLASNLEEVAKLRALSEGLLKLTRHENNDIDFQPVDLTEVTRQGVERFSQYATTKRIKLELDLKPATAKGDAASLIELVAVLVDNAIKYSPRGKSVIVRSRQTKHQAIFEVEDQGHGIKATDLTHIFERFYRADMSRSKEKVDGYGLGLSLAKHIVEAHGGVIEVSTLPGHGSTFTVKLPLG